MQLETVADGANSGLEGEIVETSLDSGLTAILAIKQYSEPLFASLRELVTNACESHVSAGKATKPFDVIVEQLEENPGTVSVTVRDYGVGMSHEFAQTKYFSLGRSTKRQSEDVGGAFGLGAKAALGVAIDKTMALTVYDGERAFCVKGFMDPQGEIRATPGSVLESNEESGVSISFVVPIHVSSDLVVHDSQKTGGVETLKYLDTESENFRNTLEGYAIQSAKFSHALLKALVPVGHPGSSYETRPRLFFNGRQIHYPSVCDVVAGLYSNYAATSKGMHFLHDRQARYVSHEQPTLDIHGQGPRTQIAVTSIRYLVKQLVVFWHNGFYQLPTDTSAFGSDQRELAKAESEAKGWAASQISKSECGVLFASPKDIFSVASDRMRFVQSDRTETTLQGLANEYIETVADLPEKTFDEAAGVWSDNVEEGLGDWRVRS